MEEVYSAKHETNVAEPLAATQEAILERAIAKLVMLGRRVGVTPEHMIALLESGLSVGELVEYMAARDGKACTD